MGLFRIGAYPLEFLSTYFRTGSEHFSRERLKIEIEATLLHFKRSVECRLNYVFISIRLGCVLLEADD